MAINLNKDIQRLTVLAQNNAHIFLQKDIENLLDGVGLYYRVFARSKTPSSINSKLGRKEAEYLAKNKKMQDLIGIRIVLYYSDDINICKKLISQKYITDKNNSEIDKVETVTFEPTRFNLICHMPTEVSSQYQPELWEDYLIDKTFEVQIRTILSEGWYEVEHDIRYKHESDWPSPEYDEYSRFLNSILATLEMCDSSMIHLMDRMAYNAYRKSRVEEMLRYKFRIRFTDGLNEYLKKTLSENKDLLKKLLRTNREDLIQIKSNKKLDIIPNTMDNIIYICNLIDMKDKSIYDKTPRPLVDLVQELDSCLIN